ncbi:MAG: hypothetical protein CL875_03440 [Dehalococcoidales bacterium]|nr:hypothetical protein [Dehalococcoidales bacterium]|tara:strand:- start:1968 stop:2255 length:288 start_codon:yes stop_codon:yes gene_type:complete
MSIEWFRDMILIICGIAATVVLIIIAVLLLSLYRKTSSLLNSLKATSSTIQGISSYVGDEIVKPLTQAVAIIQGVRQGVDTVSKFFKKPEGGKNG